MRSLGNTEEVPADYNEISFVCLRTDGCLETPSTLSIVYRTLAKKLDGFEGFHFHQLRHTYTCNLLSNGAAPKDVPELLGYSDVSTTMNVYTHATRAETREKIHINSLYKALKALKNKESSRNSSANTDFIYILLDTSPSPAF